MNKRIPLITLATAGVLVLAACASSGSPSGGSTSGGSGSGDSSPIKIGIVTPLSGAYGSEGQEEVRGMQLALKANGNKVGNHPVTLVTADGFVANDAIAAVDRLVSQEHVNIITGTYATPTSLAGSQEAAK
ncbi:MAG: transporter substrate-binding protein, partial [Frondihabitans sp.]|nr:transporter substrate-binding protein [Frondihabitans sp.]